MITGTADKSAIVTLVERSSRKVVLVHPDRDRTATAVSRALIAAFGAFPPQMRRTLTWDQGRGDGRPSRSHQRDGMPVYFCEKASPWQRGSNGKHERTTGMVPESWTLELNLMRRWGFGRGTRRG
jgi:IS30 family transposase